jgi:hypothetical protein
MSSVPFVTEQAAAIALAISAVSLIGIGGIVSTLFCHHSGCYRRGRFRHGHYKLCHKHHPDVPSDGQIGQSQISEVRQARASTDDPGGHDA